MSYDRSAIVDTHQQTKDSITHIISSTKLISLTFRANTHDVAQMDDRGDTDPNGHWIPITLHQLRLREDFRCIRIVYVVWTVVIHAHAEIMFEKQTKHGWSQTYLKASAVDREDDDTSSKLSPRPSASISGSAKFTAHAIPFSFVCTSLHTRRRFMYKVYLFAHPFSSSSLTEFSIQLNRSRFALTDWADVNDTHILFATYRLLD